MTKGKFGIQLWFYAVLAFILVFLGQTLLCGLLLGFVIAAEKNEWLSRQVIQAFSLSLAVSLITGILDFVQRALYGLLSEITYVGSGFNTVFDVLDGIISILVLVLVIIAIIKVAKEQDAGIPGLSALASKAFGIVEKKVYTQPPQGQPYPQYQQPQVPQGQPYQQYQQPQAPQGQPYQQYQQPQPPQNPQNPQQ